MSSVTPPDEPDRDAYQHPHSSILDAAYKYINDYAWTILAVGNDKRPLGSWGPGGANRYDYTNADRVYQLGTPPGIAIITGPSRLVIIDLDNDTAIRLWAERFGTPTTRIVKTPRGRHLYYTTPPGLHIPPGTEILPGIDVRGSESYAIMPPTILDAGAYTWLNDAPIQELPASVTELLGDTRAKRKTHILSGEAFTEGSRNDRLISMAGTMRSGGFDHTAILAALTETNKTRCVPPFTIREVESLADSAMRWDAGDPHGLDLFDHLRAQDATRDDDDTPILATHTRLLSTSTLVDTDPEPINWVWEDYLAPGTLNMLHGEGGLGKSYLALKLAEQILNPNPEKLFDKQIRHGNVIILDGENAETQLHQRIHNTTIQADAPLSIYICTDPILGLETYTEEYIDHLIRLHNPALIIIDSQRALWHGDEKEAGEAGRMLRRFARYIEQYACAFLLIHHDNKGGEYSGSTDINASITGSRIHLQRHKDKTRPNARTLTQPKNRIAREANRQDFTLEILQYPRSHRLEQSGITLLPYEDDETTKRLVRLQQAKTLILNEPTKGANYRDLWAAFGWQLDKDSSGLSRTHAEAWSDTKADLEAADFTLKSRNGPEGGYVHK